MHTTKILVLTFLDMRQLKNVPQVITTFINCKIFLSEDCFQKEGNLSTSTKDHNSKRKQLERAAK